MESVSSGSLPMLAFSFFWSLLRTSSVDKKDCLISPRRGPSGCSLLGSGAVRLPRHGQRKASGLSMVSAHRPRHLRQPADPKKNESNAAFRSLNAHFGSLADPRSYRILIPGRRHCTAQQSSNSAPDIFNRGGSGRPAGAVGSVTPISLSSGQPQACAEAKLE